MSDSLAPRKKQLLLCNVVMSLIAGIFMIVACASWSQNVTTVQRLAFMVVSTGASITTSGVTIKAQMCDYIGLQAYCDAMCGENILPDSTGNLVTVPYSDPRFQCVTANPSGQPTSSLRVFSDDFDTLNCVGTGSVTYPVQCTLLTSCKYGGNVTMAFAVIGCIGALFSMVIFAWRMNGDGFCPKVTSVLFSTATFICCVVAFAAFQPCAKNCYNYLYNSAKSAAAQYSSYNLVVAVAPGVGGIMAVCSFVFFIYVMIMALLIPGNVDESAKSETGLAAKDKV